MDATIMTNNLVIPITAGTRKAKRRSIRVRAAKGRSGIEIHVQMEPGSTGSPNERGAPATVNEGAEQIGVSEGPENTGCHRTFWIGADDTVGVLEAGDETPPSAVASFSSAEELLTATSVWSTSQLVRVWNKLPGARAVSRFENRKVAVERLWRAVERFEQVMRTVPQAQHVNKKRDAQSKLERIIGLLRQPGGATLSMLIEATGWQAHSVRGFLSGKLSKQLGLSVESSRRDGERVYAVSAAGVARSTVDATRRGSNRRK
jgi:hypothetical protein